MGYKPSAEQIFLGVDANNDDAVSKKTIPAADGTTPATQIVLDGLAKGTKYSAFCTASNGYLVWPDFIPITSLDAYKPLPFTTQGTADTDDDDDDSALLVSSNIVALCTMIAALIFN